MLSLAPSGVFPHPEALGHPDPTVTGHVKWQPACIEENQRDFVMSAGTKTLVLLKTPSAAKPPKKMCKTCSNRGCVGLCRF